jgi:hypothetical protein
VRKYMKQITERVGAGKRGMLMAGKSEWRRLCHGMDDPLWFRH